MTESSGLITPPTMVQTVVVLRAVIARIEGRSAAEHDIDVPAVNLNALDQRTDQIPLQRPVDGCHPVTNLPGKVFKPAHDQRQCRALRRLVPQGRSLLLPALDPLTQPGDAWLEVGLVDQTLGIAVDQPAHPAAQLGDLGLDAGQITCCGVASLNQASFVLRRDPARILQHTLDLAPDRLVQPIRAHLRVCAQALAAEAVSITAAAAIIGVGPPLALGRTQADSFAVIGVAALPAHDEPLQEVTLATGVLPIAAPVLCQLLTGRLEQLRINQRRDRDADPLARCYVVDPVGSTGLFAASAHRAQPGRHRSDPGLAEGRRSSIGGVPENAPHGAPIPGRLAAPGPDALPQETPAHLADADALPADPRKDPPHDPSLVLQDLVAGHAAVLLADIAIAIGRARQHADRALARGVALAAPAALQDLGPLVLGHHALDLQQQIVLRREADRPIEEDDLDPSPVELVDQQHLISVAPRQSVRGVDVQAIKVAGRYGIAQTLERGPHQGGSAVALVGKATLGRQGENVLSEAGLQCRDLAVDGAAGRLLLGRDAGVDGDAHGYHAHSLLVRSAVSGVVSRGEPH